MCVGALLASDVEALVYAVPNRADGAAGTMLQLAEHPSLRRRVKVVSGIRRDEVEELHEHQKTLTPEEIDALCERLHRRPGGDR